ncbi:MAG: hypothetical protein K6B14_03155 [Lachnospiraceae bacterium]|nr:hypothetical protein [Lachnospiraceae bacterium]
MINASAKNYKKIVKLIKASGIAMEYYAFDKAMNYAVDGIKQSEDVNAPIDALYNAFKDIDTPLGRPWIGKVVNVDGDCIIYGPTNSGSFLFGYYLFGTFPFWTFRLENALDGREVVKSKRIIWHILFPTYDIYLDGEKYGRMRWLFRILRTKFRMKTKDGEVVVREMTATIGDQFGVYKNGNLIGTISQKIGLTGLGTFVRDMVFDNFVIMVFDERDLPLVASLCVMLGSFKNHGIKKG